MANLQICSLRDHNREGEFAAQGKVVTLERKESTKPRLILRLNPLLLLVLILQVSEETTLLDLELKLIS